MLKTIVAVAFWSGLCLGIWLLSLSAVSDAELLVAIPSSLVCGAVAVVFQRVIGWRWSARSLPWSAFPTALLAVASDAAQVLAMPLTHRWPGRVKVVGVGAEGHGAAAANRRVAATLSMSMSPGTIVLEADDRGRITFHSLECGGPQVEDKVRKP